MTKAVAMVWLAADEADTEAMTMALYDAMDDYCDEDPCLCLIGFSKVFDITDDQTIDFTVVEMDVE